MDHLYYQQPKPKYNKDKWFQQCHGEMFNITVEFILQNDTDLLSIETYPTSTRRFIETKVFF